MAARPGRPTAAFSSIRPGTAGRLPGGDLLLYLARSALFFDGARIAGPIVVLVVWAVLGMSLALTLGGRVMNPADTEAAAATGAAV